jgi:hypothetical protein
VTGSVDSVSRELIQLYIDSDYWFDSQILTEGPGFLTRRRYKSISPEGFSALLRVYEEPTNDPNEFDIFANTWICSNKSLSAPSKKELDSLSGRIPVNIEYNEYYRVIENGGSSIRNRENKQVRYSPAEFLNHIFEVHDRTTTHRRKAWIFTKLFLKKRLWVFLLVAIMWILKLLLTPLDRKLSYVEGRFDLQWVKVEADENRTLKIFEYKASKRLVVFYLCCQISAFTIAYFTIDHQSPLGIYFRAVGKNPAMTVAFTVVGLAFFDTWLPTILVWLYNKCSNLRWNAEVGGVKV